MKPEIVLVRGLPGSGKTELAKKMVGYVHLEADMYFSVNGKYAYDSTKVTCAHDWCVASAKAALEQGKNVVVANTFAKTWELERYTSLGYPVRIIEATGNWPNVHGVPGKAIERMKERWDPLDRVLALISRGTRPGNVHESPAAQYKPMPYTDRSPSTVNTFRNNLRNQHD